MNFTYDLSYDSSVWYPVTSGSTTSWQPVANLGWRGSTESATGYLSFKFTMNATQRPCPPWPPPGPYNQISTNTFTNYVYHDTFGISHSLPGTRVETITNCPGGGGVTFTSLHSVANDGSGYTLDYPAAPGPGTVTSSAGIIINPLPYGPSGVGTKTDWNGNQISSDSSGNFYDTLSGTTPVLTAAGAGTPTSPVTFTYTAPNGQPAFV